MSTDSGMGMDQPKLHHAAAQAGGGIPAPVPDPLPASPNDPPPVFAHRPRHIPHLGHTLIFGAIVLLAFLGLAVAFGLAVGLRLFGNLPLDKVQRNPLLVVPAMAVCYLAVWGVSWFIFPLAWHRPFLDGINWNLGVARRRFGRLAFTGIAVGFAVQFLSNYLPIPKTLPIDEFFKTPSSVWLVSVFGVLIAPAFEELAFRGFLLPSLATAWDWLGYKAGSHPYREVDPASGQPRWTLAAMIFAALSTSVPFVLMHAEQLAHAWAPLAVLFAVSMVLCIVRLATGSLAASVLVHASYNFSIFATLFLATSGFRHLERIHP